jgi:ArsR family transcriptional regulator, arsenate/arsenite/antimonite-responsive transcriptional repressor
MMPAPAAATLEVRPFSRLFKALGDETRLRIVALLAHGELCVCHLEAALNLTQPTASRHLAVLRNAGVVDTRRDGSWVHYRLAAQPDPDCKQQLRTLVSIFAKRSILRQDVERLRRVKGPGTCR